MREIEEEEEEPVSLVHISIKVAFFRSRKKRQPLRFVTEREDNRERIK